MKFENGETFNGISENYDDFRGVCTYLNGDCYKGSIFEFKKNGNGTMNYADGR